VQTAQCVAQIVTRVGADRIEQRPALGRFRLGGGARLDDRNLIVAGAFCGTHRSTKILGANAPVHARHMVGTGQHVGERGEHCGFHFGRQLFRLPHRPNLALSVGAVALSHLDPRERKPANRAARILADEAAHSGAVAPLPPQPRLRAPTQPRHIWPIGIGADEGQVAVETCFAVRVAQQCPFDELRHYRIVDRCGERGCVLPLAPARQLDRLLRRDKIGRHGRRPRIPSNRLLNQVLVVLELDRLLPVRRLGLVACSGCIRHAEHGQRRSE
jgi:hypothetical protein